MLTNNLEFYGLESDVYDSLLNYGLIVRLEKSDQYVCIYKANDMYDYGFINESELHELMNLKSWVTTEDRDSFLSFCDKDLNGFLELDFCQKLFAMISFFGVEDIMGPSYDPLSLKEAIKLSKTL
jgi:hypothetical protein